MNKTLSNNFNNNPTDDNKKLYNRQRNICVSLLEKEKKNYYNNLDLKIFNDNNKNWQRIKHPFTDKKKTLKRNIIIVKK